MGIIIHPSNEELLSYNPASNTTRLQAMVTQAFQGWDDDLQPGDVYLAQEVDGLLTLDHVRLFDVVDDDHERYFRIAVPMVSDNMFDNEDWVERVFYKGIGWGAVSLRDVSKTGGEDWSMG